MFAHHQAGSGGRLHGGRGRLGRQGLERILQVGQALAGDTLGEPGRQVHQLLPPCQRRQFQGKWVGRALQDPTQHPWLTLRVLQHLQRDEAMQVPGTDALTAAGCLRP